MVGREGSNQLERGWDRYMSCILCLLHLWKKRSSWQYWYAIPLHISAIFILCSHETTMATWRATNADKMATNSGQPGELQPCRFPMLQSINHFLCHKMFKLDIKINILGPYDPYTAPADVFIALKLATSQPDLEFGDIYILSYGGSVTLHRTKNDSRQKYG